MSDLTHQLPQAGRKPVGVVEILGSLLAIGAAGLLVLNWIYVYLNIWPVEPVVEPFNVRVYRLAVGALVVGNVTAFGGLWWRTTAIGRSFFWHSAVALVGLVLAFQCQMSLG